MAEECEFDPAAWVHDVIIDLLLSTLPAEFQAAAPELADRVAEHPEVEPHIGKRWGDVSEGEGNVIAREVGIVARDVISGAASTTQSGEERLH